MPAADRRLVDSRVDRTAERPLAGIQSASPMGWTGGKHLSHSPNASHPPSRLGEALDLDHVMADPAADFEHPAQVIGHPHFSLEQKRHILRRWALKAQLRDAATTTPTMRQHSSQLEMVIDALIDLDEASSSASSGKDKPKKTTKAVPAWRWVHYRPSAGRRRGPDLHSTT